MEKKQTHREPILFIVGNKEREDEIRHILEDEWGGNNVEPYNYIDDNAVYYIDPYGVISRMWRSLNCFKNAVANGWMKEYKLPEKRASYTRRQNYE